MIGRKDLDAFPTSQLREQAIGFAKANGDFDWLWHLLRSIPATEGQIGDIDDPGIDVPSTVAAINGYLRADGDLSDTLRPQYIDYILEQQYVVGTDGAIVPTDDQR